MSQIEVMKNAVRFIEKVSAFTPVSYDDEGCETLKQLYQAIEQAEKVEPVACPYCHASATLGAVYFDQNCEGCVKRMAPTAPAQKGCPVLCELCIKRGYSECVNVTVTTPLPTAPAPAQAWAEGYHAGVNDERISEANIGIAGMGMKVEPARNNPYHTGSPPTAPAQDLSRLEPWVHGLGKAILRELQAAPAQQPLTDTVLWNLFYESAKMHGFTTYAQYTSFARAIEAAHGIKGA